MKIRFTNPLGIYTRWREGLPYFWQKNLYWAYGWLALVLIFGTICLVPIPAQAASTPTQQTPPACQAGQWEVKCDEEAWQSSACFDSEQEAFRALQAYQRQMACHAVFVQK